MNYDIFSDLPHIASALLNEPWMILPSHHRSMVEQLMAHRAALATAPGAITLGSASRKPLQQEDPPEGYVNAITSFDKESRLGIIEINGVMGKGLSTLATLCGGVDMNALHDGLDKLSSLGPVAVELYLSTPGGSVNGMQEATSALEEFAASIPVHGFTDKMCCSAGAFLATGVSTLLAAPTASLGSIGIYSAFLDTSGAYAADGKKLLTFTSGPLKGMGSPGTALTPLQMTEMQRGVDEMAAIFFAQMQRRQPENRAALDPTIHFTGGHWQAQSAAGSALHDGLMRDRATHLRHLVSAYAPAKRRSAR